MSKYILVPLCVSHILTLLEPLLRQSCLSDGGPAIWVHADQSAKAIDLECEETLVSSALVGKVLEDLLQGSLRHRVLRYVELALFVLDRPKHEADCALVLGHSELVEITALLKDFDLVE